jgi:hypothetical protein
MPMGDHEAVEGRTAVRPYGTGGVVRLRTENCMTLHWDTLTFPVFDIACLGGDHLAREIYVLPPEGQ